MFDVIRMPMERKRFYAINDCIELRRNFEVTGNFRIGFGEHDTFDIEEYDRADSYHIMKFNAFRLTGHVRLRPIPDVCADCLVSKKIDEISLKMERRPAFEIQRLSIESADESFEIIDNEIDHDHNLLREIMLVIFRVCSATEARFVFCSIDKGGIECLRRLGLRYSTLSSPFFVNDLEIVIIGIAVNSSNFVKLNPFRLVGGTESREVSRGLVQSKHGGEKHGNIFDKNDVISGMREKD